jgi:hypothetical protein
VLARYNALGSPRLTGNNRSGIADAGQSCIGFVLAVIGISGGNSGFKMIRNPTHTAVTDLCVISNTADTCQPKRLSVSGDSRSRSSYGMLNLTLNRYDRKTVLIGLKHRNNPISFSLSL